MLLITEKNNNMRIWFDISNSPHVLMFKDLINELKLQGHDIVITSRPLANTIELLDQNSIIHTPVGIHYGKSFLMKLFGYPIRVFHLWKYLRDKKIDLAISQSSFHSPLVSYILDIPSIYTNDNEHAMGNIPAFVFAQRIFVPESFVFSKIGLMSLIQKKVKRYPGIKEGIYLWRKSESISAKSEQSLNNHQRIFVRPEPSTAQYYRGDSNFLDEFINKAKSFYSITILPRNQEQLQHYTSDEFRGIQVAKTPMTCSLFIGAGGSMTREMAMVGVPTISVYQDELLEVDKILIDAGQMLHKQDLNIEDVNKYLISFNAEPHFNELMVKGKKAYTMFINEIAHQIN
jgi:predicted glycosyltransferase